jgi:hypothetical protein
VTICLNCGGVFVFDEKIQMRAMTEAETEEIMAMDVVKQAVGIIKNRGPLSGQKMPSR